MPIRAYNSSPAEDDPQPLRKPRGRLALLTLSGLTIAAVLVVVIFHIDAPPPSAESQSIQAQVTELLPPATLTAEQMKRGISDPGKNPQAIGAEGGWIQTTKDGRLAQQYRFVRVDPQPDGMLAMDAPVVQLYLSDVRVLTLRSNSALMRAPTRAIESGTMQGNVVIRLFVRDSGEPFIEELATPSMEMRTQQASFDNFQGEVTCDGDVDIQTATAHLPGTGLRLQINDVQSQPTSLSLRKAGPVYVSHLSKGQPVAATEPAPTTMPVEERAPRERTNTSGPHTDRSRRPRTAPSGPTSQPAPQFYHLTFHDNVRIRPTDAQSGWAVENADELHIIFSMQSKGLGSSIAGNALPTASVEHSGTFNGLGAMPLQTMIASLAVALLAAPAAGLYEGGDDEIVITCDGGLTMLPLGATEEKPNSPDDARFSLNGRPLRLVNSNDSTEIKCARIDYKTLSQYAKVSGSAEYPLAIETPEMHIAADWLWLDRLRHQGALEGPGEMIAKDSRPASASQPAAIASSPNIRINWRDRVELAFEPAASNGITAAGAGDKLKAAAYAGDVHVDTGDLAMRADSLTVGFATATAANSDRASPASSQSSRTIQLIDAHGMVNATSLSDRGTIACRDLHVDFEPDPAGRAAPTFLRATGDVAALDPDKQTVWSQSLEIAFLSTASSDVSASQPDSATAAGKNARVKTLTASSDVQVLTRDGTRAFADRLNADAATGTITLTGSDLLVISDCTAISGGTQLVLRKDDGSADWPGPGEFVNCANPIIADDGGKPIERPRFDQIAQQTANAVHLRAAWTDSMNYDGSVNDGAGAIKLVGSVAARSTPNLFEDDTMLGDALTLQFAKQPISASQPTDNTQPAITPPRTKRSLQQFIADGNAKLESHTWINTDHSDSPRVFFISGPHITYDNQTLEAHVKGTGSLLVRDERIQNKPTTAPSRENAPFSSKGTTEFRWTDRLDMTRQPDGTYDVAMIEGIEVRHMALDQAISTMTCSQLHARVERLAAARPAQSDATLDLGGSMQLKGLSGSGGVLIHTPARDVDCDEFEYDYATGVATLTSRADRVVTVMSKGNSVPFQAQRIVWNMIEDKVTATNVSGGSPK